MRGCVLHRNEHYMIFMEAVGVPCGAHYHLISFILLIMSWLVSSFARSLSLSLSLSVSIFLFLSLSPSLSLSLSLSLPGPDVCSPVLLRDGERTSFHIGMLGHKFVMWLCGACPCLCIISHSWQRTGDVYMSLRAEAMLLWKRSRCLAYAAKPVVVLRFISLCWFFSLRLWCVPVYK